VSTLLHATVYVFLHSLLNVLVQIANKMGFQKKKKKISFHLQVSGCEAPTLLGPIEITGSCVVFIFSFTNCMYLLFGNSG
jgi:hypothetical protein